MRELRPKACSLKSQGAAERRGNPPVGATENPKRDPAPPPVSLPAQVGWGWGARLWPPRSQAGCHRQKSLVPGHSQRNLFGFYSP